MIEALPDFLPRFFSGLVVNIEIAVLSLLIGAAVAVPLVAMLVSGRLLAVPASIVVAALRAAPTFVVMFFLLNALPRDFAPFGLQIADWGLTAVILSQSVYVAAYVADNGLVALRALRGRDYANAVLFLPNLARAFCVVLMSSGVAAAVGTPEAIFITIREAERMPDLGDRAALFLMVMVFFAILLHSAFALINMLRFRLVRWLERAA
jgi:ABC-type amino acid transport system permease subunit